MNNEDQEWAKAREEWQQLKAEFAELKRELKAAGSGPFNWPFAICVIAAVILILSL